VVVPGEEEDDHHHNNRPLSMHQCHIVSCIINIEHIHKLQKRKEQVGSQRLLILVAPTASPVSSSLK
jgi:hypothetical protein